MTHCDLRGTLSIFGMEVDIHKSSKSVSALSAAFGLLALMAGKALALDKISIADVGSGNATHWPAYIANEKGFFKEGGIEIEFLVTQSSSAAIQQLAAGSADMSLSGMPDAIRAIDQGAPVRMLRIEVGPSPYEIFGAKDVKSFADLPKKTVMIGGAKDITRVYFEDMAKAKGLDPKDVDYVFSGSTASRFAALNSGSIGATILFPPFNFKAEGLGFNRLGASADFTKNLPFSAYSVNLAWAQKNKPAIQGFTKALAKGVDWFMDTKNKQEAIAILIKAAKADPADAASSYNLLQKIRAFERDGVIEGSGFENLLKLIKDQGDLQGAAQVSRFYDGSLLR